jgi:ABC-type polar amino acid transport system ATPase subunit
LIFYHNLLINKIKVKRNLTLAPAPALWLEEGGESKRLGIAPALVIDPAVFCLDAPTADLDPQYPDII